MKSIISAVMLLSLGQFAFAGVNFDQGVDVQNVIQEAKTSDIKAPEARIGMPISTSRDCKKITFTDTSPLTSPQVPLSSYETSQDCQNFGPYVGQICTPHTAYYTDTAQIVITEPRELKPGQSEIFEVCLWGPFLSMKPVSTVYKYSVSQEWNVFRLTPQAQPARSASQEYCTLAMDTPYSCIYQCQDGSYISQPAPFPGPSMPGFEPPFHGCRPSVPSNPLITILK